MIKHVLFTIGMLAIPSLAWAQANAEPITLKDLKTPASPAFQLLGIAPSDIDRPATPRSFAVSLLSALQKGDTVLPNGLAIEVAPYWLVPHSRLEFGTYINPGRAQSIRQTFSISVATTKATAPAADADAKLMDIGVGFRTSPYAGKSTPDVERLRTKITVSAAQASVIDALFDRIPAGTGTIPDPPDGDIQALKNALHPGLTNGQYAAMLKEITDALELALGAGGPANAMRATLSKMKADGDAARQKAALELQKVNQKRLGFTMDLAGAFVTRTADAQGSGVRPTRQGAWLTTGYTDEHIAFQGLARFVRNGEDSSATSNLLDTGIRVSGAAGDLTASVEAIYRNDRSSLRKRDSTSKFVVVFEYKVSEDVTLTSTFGKDFDNTLLGRDGSTITLLGVSFGLGARPTVPVIGQ